jgi:hypothetical protein
MLSHVALATTDVFEERIASIISVTRISKLGTLAVTSNQRTLRRSSVLWLLITANVPSVPILVTLMMEVIHSSRTSVLNKSHMA